MRHVYIHVPFCRRRCSYCDFAIAVRRAVPAERYVHAVECEHRLRRERTHWDHNGLETLYLGGGTPSWLDPAALSALVASVRQTEGADGQIEVTLEANPDDVTPANASAWMRAGINRISLGIQSFDDQVLRWMHRTHDAAAARKAVRTVREAGCRNLSLDLIFALPAALETDFSRTLDQAIALEPEHLSVYGLSVEPRTPVERWIARGAVAPADDERYRSEFLFAHDALSAAGFEHYEVSNYARSGCRSRHNQAYWSGATYAGLGPAAHSFDGSARSWNLERWATYEPAVVANRLPEAGREQLSDDQRRLERLYLGLRTADGLQAGAFPGTDARLVNDLRRAGWLSSAGDRVRLTPTGWLAMDAITQALDHPA